LTARAFSSLGKVPMLEELPDACAKAQLLTKEMFLNHL